MEAYLERLVDPWISEILGSAPAVMITGARASGKTTTALRHATSVVRLDNEREALPFRADPDAALRDRPEPVLLDEWQACPEVLGAVKRAVDSERRPGRFILTGSVRSDSDPVLWPGTGRLIRVAMHPLTVREQRSRPGRPFIDGLLGAEPPRLPSDPPDLRDYAEIALRGGFPEAAVELEGSVQRAWLESYVEQLLLHEHAGPGRGPDPVRLGAFFTAYALNSAGIVNDSTLHEAAGLDRRTARSYAALLSDLGVIAELPAEHQPPQAPGQGTQALRRRHRAVGRRGRRRVAVAMSDGHLLGRLIDTFVTNQLRAEAVLDPSWPKLHHLRDRDGRHEVDIVADLGARGLVARSRRTARPNQPTPGTWCGFATNSETASKPARCCTPAQPATA